ncbi:MAG TPA: fumarylacetoacetate hydrolase family protein [Candidatus Hydrogenedentes bacterium]|nr:fumarylacetoacetate hydrolase family protein [Candidatus Hydrogenedentota bacterium]HQM49216.1 fumarylacetoacetate hydrolase family protein [Candidatus Hydrogenedentota bacterium]
MRTPYLFCSIVAFCLVLAPCTAAWAGAAENGAVRYCRFQSGETIAYGIVEGDRVRELSGDLFGTWAKTGRTHALAEVRLLVPTTPTKVLALAGNYKSHIGGQTPSAHPEVFFKVPSALVPTGADIVIPRGTEEVHYEAEMVIVIGKRGKDVPVERALEHVFGVTCGNDVSARDWQRGDIQWWRAKGSDTFGPCGPFIVSGVDYNALQIQLRLNGEVRQLQNTRDMVHDVAGIVSWISRHVTLEAGDLIFTGTMGTTQAMKPGDTVEVELENAGILVNKVAASAGAPAE